MIVLNTNEAGPTMLSRYEYNVIVEAIKLMQPFEEATCTISGDYVTLSFIILLVKSISLKLLTFDGMIKHEKYKLLLKILNDAVRNKLLKYEERIAPRLATFLDPRVKFMGFLNENNLPQAVATLKNEVSFVLKRMRTEGSFKETRMCRYVLFLLLIPISFSICYCLLMYLLRLFCP